MGINMKTSEKITAAALGVLLLLMLGSSGALAEYIITLIGG